MSGPEPVLLSLLKLEPGSAEQYAVEKQIGMKRKRRALKWLVIIAVVATMIVMHERLGKLIDDFVQWCSTLGRGAPILLGLMEACLVVVMLPTFPIMVGAGIVLPQIYGMLAGQVIAVGAVSAGLWFGSMIAFIIGRTLMKDWAEAKMSQLAWFGVINTMVAEEGWWIIFLARMSPMLPAEVFNYACSLTPVSYLGFAFGSLGSVFPASIWICITASASESFDASAAELEEDISEPSGNNSLRNRLLLIGGNVVFLLFISLVFFRAYQKYKLKEEAHVQKLVAGLVDVPWDPETSEAMKRVLTASMRRLGTDPGDVHNRLVRQSTSSFSSAAFAHALSHQQTAPRLH